ncbi:matrixin family metalloprotease [Arthrobacter terrae]|uniref:matrixin family metalloprotease n=1 Tax=Arthrobacter terrae TaxID=2935737 RepID=UPI0028A67F3E|nr:matrixin family metalloprotease [Arthrobacter terrae]
MPPSTRYPSPGKRLFRALKRFVGNFFGGLWRFTKLLTLTALFIAVAWVALGYLAPGITSEAGRLLGASGITGNLTSPVAPVYAGIKPSDAGSTDGQTPPPGVDETDHRLGTPVPVTTKSNSYAFMSAGTDQPYVSYDPCRPIHYVVRPTNAPAGGDQAIADAVAAVSRATGFVFINDGLTNEAPSADRPDFQPERYGNRWAPVLFAWESQPEQSKFTENLLPGTETTLGLGGSTAVTVDDKDPTYVTGQVRLNAAELGTMARAPGGFGTITAVVKHELAHVVGLDHVPDPTQLMAATITDQVHDFGAGDLTGLAMLGTGECKPSL